LEGLVVDVPRQPGSAAAELWQGVADAAEAYLASVTIADLLERQRELDAAAAPMYYI